LPPDKKNDILSNMPITKQAIKKMRHDKIVTRRNNRADDSIHNAVKLMRKSPSQKQLSVVFSLLDKAVKRNIIHKNKSSRVKTRLAKLLVK
jgi:small subunit ribosomal protein S20